ncbi:ABC transporter substrate-binding protein [bacterium]|nr:ABC transporter substrate-binding protein [bacterium]
MRQGSAILLLLGLLLLALAGCNPADDSGSGNTGGTTGGGTSGAGGGGEEGPVKIGFNFEETGPIASFGTSSHSGALMAVDEINAAGGILGRQIEAIWDDNASKTDEAAKVAAKHCSQDKVDVIIGAVASSNSLAIAKVAEDNHTPMVTPASTKTTLTLNEDGSVRKYIFRTCFTDDFQAERMITFAALPDGPIAASRAVIFYDADSDYSVGIRDRIKTVAPELGVEIVSEDSFLASTETDFRSKLNRFKSQDFDVLIVPGYYDKVALIANQAREVGLEQPLLGGDGFDSPDLFDIAQQSIVGSYFTNHYAADDQDPAVQNFVKGYKARNGGKTPDAMAILAYDAVYAVKQAYEDAGSIDKEAFVTAMSNLKDFKGAAGSVTINAQHNAEKKLVVLEITGDGSFKWVYTFEPEGGSAEADANPCADNPCGDNPCAENPCGENPCGENPCGDNPCGENPCGENPCGDNPCGENPCGDNPCGENPCGENPCGH